MTTELKRQKLKVGDITDIVKEATGFIKENYLAEIKHEISLLEKNLRENVLSNQLNKGIVLQGDYINLMSNLSEKSPLKNSKKDLRKN